MENTAKKVGVIIARFQTPELHEGHLKLINEAYAENDKVIVLLGSNGIKLSLDNPFSFKVRSTMLLGKFPDVQVAEIMDVRGVPNENQIWSAKVDTIIKSLTHPGDVISLYGSRDSFKSSYFGEYPVVEIEAVPDVSATQEREKARNEIIDSVDFRKGIIHGKSDKYPIVYPTVDAFIVSSVTNKILLGRKPNQTKFQFIGGFVEPTNETLEDAIVREVQEETGLDVSGNKDEIRYMMSGIVHGDVRYAKETDKIMTTLFFVPYHGDPDLAQAADDIETLKWFDFHEIKETEVYIADVHLNFFKRLKTKVKHLLLVG